MRKLAMALGTIGLALLTAACGNNAAPTSGYGSTGTTAGSGSATAKPLATKDISGIGTVLVNGSGRTLYVAAQESDGNLKCADACLSVWAPAIAPSSVTTPAGVPGTIATITRADSGKKQLTYDGSPLYTFAGDQPGEAKGNQAMDRFGDMSFTWKAVVLSGGGGAAPSTNSYGY